MMPSLTNVAVVAKYRASTTKIAEPERRARIEQCVLGIDHLPSLKEMAQLLASPVGEALAS